MDDDYVVPVHRKQVPPLHRPGWKTQLEIRQEFWELYAQDEEWGILTHGGVRIAHDGGVSGVGKLLYGLQYFYAMVMVGFGIGNIYTISKADIRFLFPTYTGDAWEVPLAADKRFLLSTWIFHACTEWLGQPQQLPALPKEEYIIMLGEFFFMVLLIARMLWFSFAAWIAPRCLRHHGDMIRWSYMAQLLWCHFPQLASFSAMRLLYYVTPSVVGTEAYMVFFMMGHRMSEATTVRQCCNDAWPMVSYIMTRIAALVIGFDAFLVKLRMVARHASGETLSHDALLAIAIFLFQTLNVVNLNLFVRERLFIFIFGGQDGNLRNEEAARADVWNALIAKRIYMHFGCWRFLVVMLGFDDYDFQMLVLEVDGTLGKKVGYLKIPEADPFPEADVLGKIELGLVDARWPDGTAKEE